MLAGLFSQRVSYQQEHYLRPLNPLSSNPIKWSNTLEQFVGKIRQIV